MNQDLIEPRFENLNFYCVFIVCFYYFFFFSKYAWVVSLKDKKGVNNIDAFQKFLKESNRKPNKIWIDKGSEFHNNSCKK